MDKEHFEQKLNQIILTHSDDVYKFTKELCDMILGLNFVSHVHGTKKIQRILPNLGTEEYIVEQRSSQLKRIDKCCYKTPFNVALILMTSIEILEGDDIPSKKDIISNTLKHIESESFGDKFSTSTWKSFNKLKF